MDGNQQFESGTEKYFDPLPTFSTRLPAFDDDDSVHYLDPVDDWLVRIYHKLPDISYILPKLYSGMVHVLAVVGNGRHHPPPLQPTMSTLASQLLVDSSSLEDQIT